MYILNATSEEIIMKPSGLPLTTLKEIHIKNGKGSETTRILKGKRVVSRKTRSINLIRKPKKRSTRRA
jgi:hypothetical protein